ncbi:uncharacterized protein LOC111107150 [Crassostrea virginica]
MAQCCFLVISFSLLSVDGFIFYRDINKFFIETTTPRFETSDHVRSKTMTSITTKLLQNSTILTTTKIQQQHQSTTPDEGISNLVFPTTLIEGESTGEEASSTPPSKQQMKSRSPQNKALFLSVIALSCVVLLFFVLHVMLCFVKVRAVCIL